MLALSYVVGSSFHTRILFAIGAGTGTGTSTITFPARPITSRAFIEPRVFCALPSSTIRVSSFGLGIVSAVLRYSLPFIYSGFYLAVFCQLGIRPH